MTSLPAPFVLRVALALVGLVSFGCQQPSAPSTPASNAPAAAANGDDDASHTDAPVSRPKLPVVPAEAQLTIRAQQAEIAELKRRIDVGADSQQGLINAHEHLYKLADLERYLPAARKAGVEKTVIVASPMFTLIGRGNDKGEPSMSENFDNSVLAAAQKYPNEIIPFCTIDPTDADKLDRLKRHVAAGAKGVKIYSGHSNFFNGSISPADMDPVWAYLEETQLPINWHINLSKFLPETEAVLKKFPKLNLMIPHYGVVFWKPKGEATEQLKRLLRTYPHLFVDTSLGTREILLDGMAVMESERQLFIDFFAEFSDRIVWGTDSVITGNVEKSTSWYYKVMLATRDQLEKEVFTTELAAGYSKYFKKERDAEGRYQGLALSPAVLDKVYRQNAKRWLHLQ